MPRKQKESLERRYPFLLYQFQFWLSPSLSLLLSLSLSIYDVTSVLQQCFLQFRDRLFKEPVRKYPFQKITSWRFVRLKTTTRGWLAQNFLNLILVNCTFWTIFSCPADIWTASLLNTNNTHFVWETIIKQLTCCLTGLDLINK